MKQKPSIIILIVIALAIFACAVLFGEDAKYGIGVPRPDLPDGKIAFQAFIEETSREVNAFDGTTRKEREVFMLRHGTITSPNYPLSATALPAVGPDSIIPGSVLYERWFDATNVWPPSIAGTAQHRWAAAFLGATSAGQQFMAAEYNMDSPWTFTASPIVVTKDLTLRPAAVGKPWWRQEGTDSVTSQCQWFRVRVLQRSWAQPWIVGGSELFLDVMVCNANTPEVERIASSRPLKKIRIGFAPGDMLFDVDCSGLIEPCHVWFEMVERVILPKQQEEQ